LANNYKINYGIYIYPTRNKLWQLGPSTSQP